MNKRSKRQPVDNRGFAGIPRIVMESKDYKSLKGSSLRLLLELTYQYNGKNNGDLTCAWSVLRIRGFRSEDTINRAKKELISLGFIIETRKGIAGVDGRRVCSLFALTFKVINQILWPDGTDKINQKATKVPVRTKWEK